MSDKEKIDSTPMPPAPDTSDEKPILPPAPPSPDALPPTVEETPEYDEFPQEDALPARAKSPVAATILAFVPFGLGHLYLGQYSRATAFFVGFWAPILLLDFPLLLLGVFFYFFAIMDAYRQAQLINLAFDRGEEAPASTFSGGLSAGVFLIVLGAVLILKNWVDFYFIHEILHDWWPALLILMGAWFIWGAVKERKSSDEAQNLTDY